MPRVSAPDPAEHAGGGAGLHAWFHQLPPASDPRKPRRNSRDRRLHARAPGGRGSFRPPDAPLESQDAPLHLHGAGRDLHHRPAADAGPDRGGPCVRAQHRRARRVRPVRRDEEAVPGLRRRRGGACRDALREPSLARRAPDQLAHDLRAHQPPARPAAPARRRPARAAAVQGAHLHDERAREARGQPGRRRRHEVAPGRRLRRRPAQGAARRARGAQAEFADHRPRGHELRPGRRRLHHPGQRRRDPLLQPRRADDRQRDRGRQDEGDRGGDGRSRSRPRGSCSRRGGRGRARPAEAAADEPAPAEAAEEPAEGEPEPAAVAVSETPETAEPTPEGGEEA